MCSVATYPKRRSRNKWSIPIGNFPSEWRQILLKEVSFYRALDNEGRSHFEFKVHEFLHNVRITAVKTTVDDLDKVLVAASAIIPIYSFKNWQYNNSTKC